MGCPLAAAAFTLTLHLALHETHQELTQTAPTTTVTAYMDDVNILTPHVNLINAHATIKRNLSALGLLLNDSKTECWINEKSVAPSTHYQSLPRSLDPSS